MSKKQGNISEIQFISAVISRGGSVSIPFGDNEKYDAIVDWKGLSRVQIKSTSRRDTENRSDKYSLLCASGLKQKVAYTKNDVDFIAAHVIPENAWYIIPIEKINGIRINLYPHKENTKNKYEKWKERWDLL